MSRLDDKTLALLSGYAAGVLSAEEHAALMDAALRDQEVFDALAGEEALRQLLADDAAKTRLLGALEPPRKTPWYRRPWAWTAAVPVLAGMFLFVFLPSRKPEPQLVAEVRRNEAAAVAEAPAPPVAKSVKSVEPVPENRTRAYAPAPSALTPGPAQESTSQPAAPSSPPALAGAASASQERQEEAKVALNAVSVSAPAPVQASPPAAVRDAKRVADESASALAVSSFRQEGDLAAAAKQKADIAAGVRQKNEAPAVRDAEVAALKVEILTRRSPDLPWSAVQDDSVASGDAIRLRITTAEGGELRIRPGDRVLSLRTPVAPIEVDLGVLPDGLQTITVSLNAPPSGGLAREPGAARSAMTMGAVSNKPSSAAGERTPVVVVRRIRVAPR